MTPEDIVRLRTYDPHYDDPNPPEIHGHGYGHATLKHDVAATIWTARMCWGAAFLIFGFILGKSL